MTDDFHDRLRFASGGGDMVDVITFWVDEVSDCLMVETLMVDPVEDHADNLGGFPQAAFDPSVMHEAGSDGFSDARASSSSVF